MPKEDGTPAEGEVIVRTADFDGLRNKAETVERKLNERDAELATVKGELAQHGTKLQDYERSLEAIGGLEAVGKFNERKTEIETLGAAKDKTIANLTLENKRLAIASEFKLKPEDLKDALTIEDMYKQAAHKVKIAGGPVYDSGGGLSQQGEMTPTSRLSKGLKDLAAKPQ